MLEARPRLCVLASILSLALLLLVGCTKENAAFCCIDAADCAAHGVDEASRACAGGLACVENSCVVASCASEGCGAAAPVCELTTDTCGGCGEIGDCARFPSTSVCDLGSGACVECVMNPDCGTATAPICGDDHACRGCTSDTECASGACADDGSCVAEADVIYLHPTGTDAVPCSRTAPCKELFFAIQQATNARRHVVLSTATYTLFAGPLIIDSQWTSATSIVVHGGGSTLDGGSDDGFVRINIPTTLIDLGLVNTTGIALSVNAAAVLRRVRLGGLIGLGNSGQVTAYDLHVRASGTGISNGGSLSLNRATIEGGTSALQSTGGTLDIANLLVFGTSAIAVDIFGGAGSVASTTIFSTAGTPDPAGFRCSGMVTLRESIVWTPTVPSSLGFVSNCPIIASIIGPTAVAGAMSSNPLFVDPLTNDFHLSGGSPARDAVDTGPATDFEGDPRPRGARFDIGADEAP